MSSELVLLCWLLGNEPYRIFTVKIQGSETVSTLKEKIKEKKSDIDCPADALIIWKNETSNTDEGSLFGLNQDVCRNIPGARKLDAWHRLSTVFTDALEYEQKIHVFVQSPTLFIRPNSPISSGSGENIGYRSLLNLICDTPSVDWDIGRCMSKCPLIYTNDAP
ncbi:hypothetical protein M405DRAFT_117101 [Rhizopogon salebrosus TDB-379]|nr:hypothetical protein M405DRAFT_117101 [Rhizopogon salebrosus TDB-379]